MTGCRKDKQGRSHTSAKVSFVGTVFDNLTMAEVIGRIDEMVWQKIPRMIVTANVDHILRMHENQEYAELVQHADMVLADGQPIVWAVHMLGQPLKERVAGSDLLLRLCKHAAKRGHRIFLMGGDPGVAETARDVLQRRFSGLQVVGTYCPPKGFEKSIDDNQKVVEAVRSASPDILFVALGSPKQEKWIAEYRHQYHVPVSIGVGISLSFVSGHVKRAPLWMQHVGLEWVHRLWCEPYRLCHRYLIHGPAFIPLVIREFILNRLSKSILGESRLPGIHANGISHIR